MQKMNLQEIENLLQERFNDDKFTTLKELPLPCLFKDMDKATKRIVASIKNKEKITIIGDYDADGITSTAIMISFFKDALGIDVNYIIPNRFIHGYGFSKSILEFIDEGLIITVDNGISSHEAATLCKKKGLDLIITDHHTCSKELPKAFAIVNPKQDDCEFPFSDICGANVAWYLCASIKNNLKINYQLSKLLDLLTIAIIADVMPMKSLNKTLIKKGFLLLKESSRPAIIALKERFGLIDINEGDIGFKIAPLINCAGRMEDGKIALDFLLARDLNEANKILEYLINLNEQRKQEQLEIYEMSKKQVHESDEIVIVSDEDWNEGIIGIVASKLCEKYKKPAFVFKENNDYLKGSARSLGDIHLYNLIEHVKEYTLGFGGHKGAAGLSIAKKDFNDFKNSINNVIKTLPKEKINHNEIFASIDLSLVGHDLYELINVYRPYGLDNKMPLFYFENLYIKEVRYIGKDKEYKKLVVTDGIYSCDVLVFKESQDLNKGDKISFSASIEKNIFRQNTNFNLLLKEFKGEMA